MTTVVFVGVPLTVARLKLSILVMIALLVLQSFLCVANLKLGESATIHFIGSAYLSG